MDQILSLLKVLLGITDLSQDTILNFYITKAKNAIKKYCLLTEDDYNNVDLTNQIAELALYYFQNKKNLGLNNKSEGIKSFSFESGIPQSIKDNLPSPAIILM